MHVALVGHSRPMKVRHLLSVDCHDVPSSLAISVATTLLSQGTDIRRVFNHDESGTPIYVEADTEFEEVVKAMRNLKVALVPIIDKGRLIGLLDEGRSEADWEVPNTIVRRAL
jgi:predicted transcriptional regulator